jgi:hypothetical protein
MANISNFKAQMQGGGARPNQFVVELTFPAFVGTIGNNAAQAASFLCRASSLPASQQEDIQLSYRGRPVHFAGERSFAPWSISVYNETNFLIRNMFEIWQNGMLEYATTNGIMRPMDYQVDMAVYQLDRNDRVIKGYTFYDAYPTNVSSIALDFEQNNTVEQFDVDFVYNYFVPNPL